MIDPKSGYTLPVFACAGAIAALQKLLTQPQASMQPIKNVVLDLVEPAENVTIPVEQLARLSENAALAITRSDPGDNLDLTRNTPIWSIVSWADDRQTEQILVEGGEGVGRHAKGAENSLASSAPNSSAIYAYARKLLQANLTAQLTEQQKIRVTIILPEGQQLALRTSNAAFGVVDGLSLLGTSGIAQPLSAPGQLARYRQTLKQKAAEYDDLVFCLGENGLDLALKQGIAPERRLKTANWIGPLLVEAGLLGVRSILLFGYHGKLIKLAGGIFHTHHHIADARVEIMAACCAEVGLQAPTLQQVLSANTTESALEILRKLDHAAGSTWVEKVYCNIAERIDRRSSAYIQTHGAPPVHVGSVLFDRSREIVIKSFNAQEMLPKMLP